MSERSSKVVVFDLDETLGYFTEFSIFYGLVIRYARVPRTHHQEVFNGLFELYPEYLRPEIIDILKYLKRKKKDGECSKVFIYTNNQGPVSWCNLIKNYLESKIKYNLFDRVVGAFKINGRVREICRRTNEKTTQDLIRCAELPQDSHICFIDNVDYKKMSNVYYIKVNTYIYNLSLNCVVNRFLNNRVSSRLVKNKKEFVEYANENLMMYPYDYTTKTEDEYEMDLIVSKKLKMFLEEFFN